MTGTRICEEGFEGDGMRGNLSVIGCSRVQKYSYPDMSIKMFDQCPLAIGSTGISVNYSQCPLGNRLHWR